MDCQRRGKTTTTCHPCIVSALTAVMLRRRSCTQQLHGVTHSSPAYVCTFILQPNCLSDLCYPKEDLELMAINFFREDPSHGRGKKTRKEGTMGILLLSHPSWAWLELAPITPMEPSTAGTPEAATMTPSTRDVLSGKVGSRWAKQGSPSLYGRHSLREGDCFYQSRDSARRGRLSVGFNSKEGMAKHSHSSRKTLSRCGLSH